MTWSNWSLCVFFAVDMFLFHNGTNSSSSGFTKVDACNTFPNLLEVFQNNNYTKRPLKVFTDMSITINNTLTVRDMHFWWFVRVILVVAFVFFPKIFSDGDTMKFWGHSNSTLCKRICLNFLHSRATGTQKLQALAPKPPGETIFCISSSLVCERTLMLMKFLVQWTIKLLDIINSIHRDIVTSKQLSFSYFELENPSKLTN